MGERSGRERIIRARTFDKDRCLTHRPPSSLHRVSKPNRPETPAWRALTAIALIASQLLAVPAARAQVLPGMSDGAEMTATAERQLGDRIARELYRDPDYVDDPVVVDYVQEIWQRLMAAARTRGELTPELDERYAWTVLLGHDRTINAFALPGGYLGLNMGLIAVVGSRDELAAVLGHELSHVTQRHISRMLTQQSRQAPWLIAAMILGAVAASKSRSGGDLGAAVMTGGSAFAQQKQLDFSRDMEREADRIGYGVMTQAGFSPRGAASMFERLQFASRLNDNGAYPYLRSHPLTSERITEMQARFQFRAEAVPPLPLAMDHAMISARARVLTRPGVDVLRQWVEAADSSEFAKTSPAQQAGTLYAAALGASELRDARSARALAERLVARTRGDAAASRLARLLSAEIELAARNGPAAAALLNTKAKDRAEMMLAAQAAIATHNPGPMTAPLRDWVATHPRDNGAWRMLSALYNEQGDPLRAIRADAEANVAILDYVAARDRFKAAQELVRANADGRGPLRIDHYEASIIDTRAREVDVKAREQMNEKPL